MIGNHLLDYRLLKEHHQELLAEGTRHHLAHSAPVKRSRSVRAVVARFGGKLEAVAHRLQALDSTPAGRH